MSFQIKGPITAERATAATEWIIENAPLIGEARAHRDKCENMLRVVKALEMKASDEKSAAAQEREAYASPRYEQAIDNLFAATKEHETLLSTKQAAQCVVEMFRSLNSALKASRA